jgi:hypothetical protein
MQTQSATDVALVSGIQGLVIGLMVGVLFFLWAYSKRQSRLGAECWVFCAIMGAILGWRGMGIAAIASAIAIAGSRTGTASKRVPCPYCREMIMPGAKVCRFCGRDLEVA